MYVCFIVPLVAGGARFANLRGNFTKRKKKSAVELCQILFMVNIEFVINSTHVQQHMRVTISCRYALSPVAGRCF